MTDPKRCYHNERVVLDNKVLICSECHTKLKGWLPVKMVIEAIKWAANE